MEKELLALADDLRSQIERIESKINSSNLDENKEHLSISLDVITSVLQKINKIIDRLKINEKYKDDVFYILEMNNHIDDESVGICTSLSSLKSRIKAFIGTDSPMDEFVNSEDNEEYGEFETACNGFTVKVYTLPLCDYDTTTKDEKVIIMSEDTLLSPRYIRYTYSDSHKSIDDQVSDELGEVFPGYVGINSKNSEKFGVSFIVKEYDYIETL